MQHTMEASKEKILISLDDKYMYIYVIGKIITSKESARISCLSRDFESKELARKILW